MEFKEFRKKYQGKYFSFYSTHETAYLRLKKVLKCVEYNKYTDFLFICIVDILFVKNSDRNWFFPDYHINFWESEMECRNGVQILKRISPDKYRNALMRHKYNNI